MSVDKYPHLFEPIVLGNTFFRNRIFASPTGFQDLNGDGYLNEQAAAAYYERKARGGVASVASFEGIVDGEFGRADRNHIALDTPNIKYNISTVAHSIRKYGAVASLELAHTGMYANRHQAFFGGGAENGIAYGPVENEIDERMVLPFDEAMFERTIQKYADAAALAKLAGFGMVTIHAGHGWLLHQFMSPYTNTRTDEWGGESVENRTRLTKEVCKAIRKVVGRSFPIEIRISGSECYDGGYDIEDGIEIAKQLDDYVDLIHVSAGNHEVLDVFCVTHPSMFLPDGVNVQYAAEIKKHVKTPVAAIGALSDPEMMEEIIASGKADVVEGARVFLAEPDFVQKIRSDQEKDAKRCMRCLSCFSNEMIHGEPYCAINPETGRELELKYYTPQAPSRKVLVIGGGVAGMQAALTCNKLGHDVTLCEKKDVLGGVIRCEKDVKFKKNLDYYLDQQERLVKESDIKLDLNTVATEEYVKKIAPDAIICAIGAKPIMLNLPGTETANTMSAQDAYVSVDKLGDKVLIIGAGLVGVELGLYLIDKGKEVQIVEMLDHVNDGGNFLHMIGLDVEMRRVGLKPDFETSVERLDGGKAYSTDKNGNEIVYEADTIVFAVGQVPLREEASAFRALAPEFQMIGDCVSPRNLTDANAEGFFTARNIR